MLRLTWDLIGLGCMIYVTMRVGPYVERFAYRWTWRIVWGQEPPKKD
jgi:hypothetical protein